MPNYKQAVERMCKECIYDPQAAGNWKQQVTICTSFQCPLYPVRPKSSKPIPQGVLDDYGLEKGIFPASAGFRISEHERTGESAYSGSKNADFPAAMGQK